MYPLDFSIQQLDHAVENVLELALVIKYVKGFIEFHEFSKFTAKDMGTSESKLNSMVLTNNNKMVLLLMNKLVFGTKRKS